MDINVIGVIVSCGVSFFILYTRKSKWMKSKIVWLFCLGLLAIGLLGFLYSNMEHNNEKRMYFGFCIPIIYWIFDRLFKRISEKLHQRDLILYLRGSDEINDGIGAPNPHVKNSDKLFSFGLLIIIVGSLLVGIQVL